MSNERAELFETYRSAFRLLLTATSIFLAANVTVIGIAVKNGSAFLILAASLFPIMLMITYFLFSRIYCALFFSAMYSELKNGQGDDLFFSISLSISDAGLYKKLKEIVMIDNFEIQTEELQKIQNNFTPPFSIEILSIAIVLHIIASLGVWKFAEWSFV